MIEWPRLWRGLFVRQYSDNLILVGNRFYDQNPQEAIGNTVSGGNIAYTFHYYANSHCWSGAKSDGKPCEGANAQQAINAGLSLFVSEWGTANSDGGGNPDQGRNTSWQSWMDGNLLSWANWSASKVDEGTAAFQGSSNRYSLSYTTSGNMVKGYLASNPTSYTACPNGSGNGGGNSAIAAGASVNMDVSVSGKMLYVSGVKNASVDVFDLQGRAITQNRAVAGSMSLEGLKPGSYVFRIASGSMSKILRLQVK